MNNKSKSMKKTARLSTLKLGETKGVDFKVREAKKIEHASLCAGATFSLGK